MSLAAPAVTGRRRAAGLTARIATRIVAAMATQQFTQQATGAVDHTAGTVHDGRNDPWAAGVATRWCVPAARLIIHFTALAAAVLVSPTITSLHQAARWRRRQLGGPGQYQSSRNHHRKLSFHVFFSHP